MTARIVITLQESGRLETRGNVSLDRQLGILEMAKFGLLQQLSQPSKANAEPPSDEAPTRVETAAVGLARTVA